MSGRIAGLDALRGIAVGLVMLRHALPEVFPGAGVVGVVMFFSLSGYLITGLLLDELQREGRVSFGRFYVRRAARLVPALVVMMAVFAAVTLLFDPLGDRDELPRTLFVAFTWTADLPFPHGSDAIFHLWTLALEEQFYLVWPAALVFAARRWRIRPLFLIAGALAAGACLATLAWLAPHPDLAYALPTSWVGCFVIGAAARVWRDRLRPPRWAGPVALVVLLVASVLALRGHASTYLFWGPLIAVLTGVLVLSWRHRRTVVPVLRPLVLLGTLSYGAYLWNYPLNLWLRDAPFGPALAAGLTIVAAALSWMLVERPLQRRLRVRTLVTA